MHDLYKRFTARQDAAGTRAAGADGAVGSAFFTADWDRVRAARHDVIVIGTGPAGVAFIERTLENNPHARILVLERGGYWLPLHYQMLPPAFQDAVKAPALDWPWTRAAVPASVSAPTTAPVAVTSGGVPFEQAGTVAMLGGRSTCWGAWCPAPEPDQLRGWPQALVDLTLRPGFWDEARAFLHVTTADRIDDSVYGCLQRQLDINLRENVGRLVPSAEDVYAAPLAVGHSEWQGVKFHKYSSVGALLGLQQRQKALAARGLGKALTIVDRCPVERLLHDGRGTVTALATARGQLDIGDAKIVLAMGTIPPATLLMHSFGGLLPNAGRRYTGHFMSRFTARVKRSAFRDLAALELGAHYLHGRAKNDLQYHVQVSAFASSQPQHDYPTIACEAPDAAAMASLAQLRGSEDHVLFVCTALGEIGETGAGNRVRPDGNAGASLHLQAGPMELALWDLLDDATCQTIEALASRHGSKPLIEYWVGEDEDNGGWQPVRPPRAQVRLPVVVHEASTLWIGDDPGNSVVGLDYRPHGVHNVYVTGGALFPTAGSWNPTLTVCALAQHLADNLS